ARGHPVGHPLAVGKLADDVQELRVPHDDRLGLIDGHATRWIREHGYALNEPRDRPVQLGMGTTQNLPYGDGVPVHLLAHATRSPAVSEPRVRVSLDGPR